VAVTRNPWPVTPKTPRTPGTPKPVIRNRSERQSASVTKNRTQSYDNRLLKCKFFADFAAFRSQFEFELAFCFLFRYLLFLICFCCFVGEF